MQTRPSQKFTTYILRTLITNIIEQEWIILQYGLCLAPFRCYCGLLVDVKQQKVSCMLTVKSSGFLGIYTRIHPWCGRSCSNRLSSGVDCVRRHSSDPAAGRPTNATKCDVECRVDVSVVCVSKRVYFVTQWQVLYFTLWLMRMVKV